MLVVGVLLVILSGCGLVAVSNSLNDPCWKPQPYWSDPEKHRCQ